MALSSHQATAASNRACPQCTNSRPSSSELDQLTFFGLSGAPVSKLRAKPQIISGLPMPKEALHGLEVASPNTSVKAEILSLPLP
jgi:hypothetical protein